VEAVHLPVVPLVVDIAPAVRRVCAPQRRQLERRMADTGGRRLRVSRRWAEPGRLHLRCVAEVVVKRPVLLARDDDVAERGLRLCITACPRGSGCRRPERAACDGDSRGPGPPEEDVSREGVLRCHWPALLTRW